MIFPDINVLIYAYDTGFKHHKLCAAWLESAMNGDSKVCYSWHTIMGFLRITTTPRVFPNPFTAKDSMEIVAGLMDSSNSVLLNPGEDHFKIFRRLVNETGIAGAKLSDAHIAALAIEHGATVASADRDFRLFDGLKLINPLAEN